MLDLLRQRQGAQEVGEIVGPLRHRAVFDAIGLADPCAIVQCRY